MRKRFRVTRALRHPNYRLYAAGNSISVIGYWVQRVALHWLTWQLTESPGWLAIIAFADMMPTVIFGPLAGALADRVDRLKAMIVIQSLAGLQAFALAALVAFDAITIEVLLGLTIFLGCIVGCSQAIRFALVPSLVPPDDLSAAIAFNSLIFNTARFVGPVVAGVVIVEGGVGPAFAFNGLSYVALLIALVRIRIDDAKPAAGATGNLITGIVEGVRAIARHTGMAPLMLLFLVSSMAARPFAEVLAAFADGVHGRGESGLAWLTSASGIGAMAAGLWLAGRGPELGLTRMVLWSAVGLGAALIALAVSQSFWIAVASVAVGGYAMVAGTVGTQTLMQAAVPDHLRGRVMSLYGLTFRGGVGIGVLAMGGLGSWLGIQWPVAAGGLICLTAGAILFVRVRPMEHSLEARVRAPDAAPEDPVPDDTVPEHTVSKDTVSKP